MDIIEMTRELGRALQNDDRYIAYNLAKQVNDEDKELNDDVERFSELRNELNKNMIVFQGAQKALEDLVTSMNQIITMCANGEDPDTCQPSTGCTGSCSTCGGCH